MSWLKKNPIPAKNFHFLHELEYIVLIRDKGAYFNLDCSFDDYRKTYYVTIGGKSKVHPAQKPIDLIKKYIKVLSNTNDIIFDPFVGSGTTLVSAKNLKRRFLGFDINKEFVKLSIQRLNENLNNFMGV